MTIASHATTPTATSTELRLVTFDVSEDQFALDIMGIDQILKYEGSTEIPRAPEFVEGIILLRNQVIPIIDLRRRLFPALEANRGDKRILVVRLPDLVVGLKVDRVRQIVSVKSTDILAAPPMVQGLDAEFLRGVVRIDGAVVLLLDLEKILTVAEREVLGRTPQISGLVPG